MHFSRSLPSNSWWQTMVGCQVLSRPSAAEGGGRRPAFTGPATQPYSATEVDGWQRLSRVSQNRAAVQPRQDSNAAILVHIEALHRPDFSRFITRQTCDASQIPRPVTVGMPRRLSSLAIPYQDVIPLCRKSATIGASLPARASAFAISTLRPASPDLGFPITAITFRRKERAS